MQAPARGGRRRQRLLRAVLGVWVGRPVGGGLLLYCEN